MSHNSFSEKQENTVLRVSFSTYLASVNVFKYKCKLGTTFTEIHIFIEVTVHLNRKMFESFPSSILVVKVTKLQIQYNMYINLTFE